MGIGGAKSLCSLLSVADFNCLDIFVTFTMFKSTFVEYYLCPRSGLPSPALCYSPFSFLELCLPPDELEAPGEPDRLHWIVRSVKISVGNCLMYFLPTPTLVCRWKGRVR